MNIRFIKLCVVMALILLAGLNNTETHGVSPLDLVLSHRTELLLSCHPTQFNRLTFTYRQQQGDRSLWSAEQTGKEWTLSPLQADLVSPSKKADFTRMLPILAECCRNPSTEFCQDLRLPEPKPIQAEMEASR